MQVQTIPTFVVLETETGEVITDAARDAVDADPDGANFPWPPPAISSLAAGSVFNHAGETAEYAALAKGKVTALYFSAHWCPPCRQFTPQLVDFYNSKRGTPEEFEIVFVSRCAVCPSRDTRTSRPSARRAVQSLRAVPAVPYMLARRKFLRFDALIVPPLQ